MFENMTAIVTGGSSGVGRATALELARGGARVLITGRRGQPLEEVANSHPNIEAFVSDAAKPEDATRSAEHAIALWGRLDILVNNAGAGAVMPLEEAGFDKIAEIFSTNVFGPTFLLKAALPHLEASKGAVVNVSSTFGHKATARLAYYAASKAALEHLTRCWALELAPRGIRVNAVALGPTETAALQEIMKLGPKEIEAVKERERREIPLGRRGTSEDVAPWILSLVDPANTWITGHVLNIDGGLTLV